MGEDLISPHSVSLPFPLGNGARVPSTKLSTAEELFQNQQSVCTSFGLAKIFTVYFIKCRVIQNDFSHFK